MLEMGMLTSPKYVLFSLEGKKKQLNISCDKHVLKKSVC